MTATMHTPGPWTRQNVAGVHYITARAPADAPWPGVVIAAVPDEVAGYTPLTEDERENHARLLTAAPDLLAALVAIDSSARDVNADGDVLIPSHVMDFVAQAIAHARGE